MQFRFVFVIVTATIAMVCLSGCSFVYHIPEPEPPNQGPFSREYADLELELIGRDELDLGIALSGGGIRSALFSLGVLKSLYDDGLLENVDVLSSVSGGGYTAYWLYMNQVFGDSDLPNFGDPSFQESVFSSNLCEIITTGNFHTYRDYLAAIFTRRTHFGAYQASIRRTFGRRDSLTHPFQLHQLQSFVGAQRIPYPIINATLVNPEPSGWADGLFELTPLMRGNNQFGYELWQPDSQSSRSSIPLQTAVAISGAAQRNLLAQRIDIGPRTIAQEFVELSDGGHSENLGVVALIRRRVKNIIVVDAEHDPDYEFEGYQELKNRLLQWGWELEIPTIDAYLSYGSTRLGSQKLQSGIHIGAASTTSNEDDFEASVIYVKMSLPDSIENELDDAESFARGQSVHDRIFNALEATEDHDGNWNCGHLSSLDIGIRDWFTFNVKSYSTYLNGLWGFRIPGSLQSFFATDFPQYTTSDQSFYLDQSLAFVGLGYLLGSDICEVIRDGYATSLACAE